MVWRNGEYRLVRAKVGIRFRHGGTHTDRETNFDATLANNPV